MFFAAVLLAITLGLIGGAFAGGYIQISRSVTTTTQEEVFLVTVTQTATALIPVQQGTQQTPQATDKAAFLGNWNNTNPNTNDIVSLQVTTTGGLYYIHVWGACIPLCDWGEVPLYFYGSAAYGDATIYYANAVYQFGFETDYLTLQFAAPNTLQAIVLTHFTDSSGRHDYSSINTFYQS